MKRTVPLLLSTGLVATTAAVITATGPAGAEPAVTAAADGTLLICHNGLGTAGRINGFFTREDLESGTATSGTDNRYVNARGCFSAVEELGERSRLTFGYTARPPYRLKSVRVQQTDGARVSLLSRSDIVRVLMDEGEKVTVTFTWVRTRSR